MRFSTEFGRVLMMSFVGVSMFMLLFESAEKNNIAGVILLLTIGLIIFAVLGSESKVK